MNEFDDEDIAEDYDDETSDNDSSLNSLVLSPEAHSLVGDCPECGTPKYHWERVGTNWHCPKCDGDFPIASALEDFHEGIKSESFGKSETGPLGRDEEEEEEKGDLGDTDDFEKPRGRYGDSTEIKVSLIAGEYHVRLYANDKLVDEMACKNKSDLGWVSRDMMMWYSKMGGNSAHAESARDRHGKESSVTPAGVRYLGKNLKESRLWMQPTKASAVNEGFFDKRMEDEDEEEFAESTMGADGEWDLDAKITRALGQQKIMRESRMSDLDLQNQEAEEALLKDKGDFGSSKFVTDEDELEEDRAGMREAAEDLGDVGDFEKPGPSPTYTLKYTIYPSRGIGQPKRKTIKFKARNNLSALKITLFKLSFDYDIPNAWATFLEELPEYVDGEINEENLKAALDYNAEEYSVESLTDAAGNLIYTIGEDSDDEEEEWDEMEESTTHESRIREENEKVFAVADSLKSVLDIFFPELKGVYMDAMESGDADALKTLIHTIDQEVLGEPASYNEETVRICKRIREYLQ